MIRPRYGVTGWFRKLGTPIYLLRKLVGWFDGDDDLCHDYVILHKLKSQSIQIEHKPKPCTRVHKSHT